MFDRSTHRLVTTLQPLDDPNATGTLILDVEFSPDGRRLVMAAASQMVAVYDTETWRETVFIPPASEQDQLEAPGFHEIVFTPDGSLAVTHSIFHGIQLRDPATLAVLRTSASITQGFSIGRVLDITADGSMVEVSGPEGVTFVDLDTLEPVGDPYPHETIGPFGAGATYAHDADRLATTVGDVAVVWNLDPSTWRDIACRVVGRNLTPTEWETYGFTEPFRHTCPQWGDFGA